MFVDRNTGVIYGTWTVRQWPGQEELPDDHPDILAFRAAIIAKLGSRNPIAMCLDYIATKPDAPQEIKDIAPSTRGRP